MATIVLQAAGAWLGGVFGAVGTAVGSAAGALGGYLVDRAILTGNQHYQGPRLASAKLMTAEEGSPLPRLYGTVRVGGALIWATRFEERSTTTRQGAKGGPKQTTYSYFANAAVALCEGEITGVRRIWADGRELDLNDYEIRVYKGDEEQQADPLIEAKQGAGNAPAYRGTAYVVFERFPIDDFGRRIPQFQFEVLKPGGQLQLRIRSVALIPGATEYGLSPKLVTASSEPGETIAVNRHNLHGATDFEAALDELQMVCPNLSSVSLVVSWFGTDLRAAHCTIRPMVVEGGGNFSQAWQVCGISRGEAQMVSRHGERAAYGGTPSDQSVIDAIRALRDRGLKVNLYPFIMMDIPTGNELPDPHGGGTQAAYPWRGRITCGPAPGQAGSPDKTASAREQIQLFAGGANLDDFAVEGERVAYSGDPAEWSFRRHILHYAYLAIAAGGVDGFIIGSEMPGLTSVRGADNSFPFVEILTELAQDVRSLLGSGTTITYAADWSEYFGYRPEDGSHDVFFNMDALWSSPAIDCIGIDNYMPLSDWRDEDSDGSGLDGAASRYSVDALRAGIASGEGYDWYYASETDRAERIRSAISDGAYGKDWVFRYKDLAGWWSEAHFNRIGGIEETAATGWVPKSKPFHLLEVGCGAVDKGANQPNVFPDPKSAESKVPYFSNGGRSDLAQYNFLLAHHLHWQDDEEANPVSPINGAQMVDPEQICVWAWDLRPFPAFPIRADAWGDGENWDKGHWLNGRISGIPVGALINAILTDHNLSSADIREAHGMIGGYVVSNPTTARAALEPIIELFGIGVRSDAGQLIFASEGAGEGPARIVEELVVPAEGETVLRIRTPDNALPARAQLDFRDQLNEHQSATAAVSYMGAKGSGTAFVSFPGILATSEAKALIATHLRRVWDRREQIGFSVPVTRQDIRIGSVIGLAGEGKEFLVTEIEEGLTRKVRAEGIARVAEVPGLGGSLPRQSDRTGYAFGPPHALFLDLPMTGEGSPLSQFRVAARAKPWKGQAVYCSPGDSGFSVRTLIGQKAVMGTLLDPLPGSGVEGRFDRSISLRVKLLDGELESVPISQVLNGANAAAVLSANGAWEVLQFLEAEETEIGVWRLKGLLRGQVGTNDALAAGSPVGAAFVLLDAAVVPAGLKAGEVGLLLNWRVSPVGHDLSAAHFSGSTLVGGVRALRPLSPVHLKAETMGDDIRLSWIRRGRIDADDWLGEDIPLGEENERYLVEVLEEPGAQTVRSVIVTQPEWIYEGAMLASDFTVKPVSLGVRISQMSQAIGTGIPAYRTIHPG